MNKTGPVCIVFSAAGARLALALQAALSHAPWRSHSALSITAPPRLIARQDYLSGIAPYQSLYACIAGCWNQTCALIFIGATGIAVRAITPFLAHKQNDPPVLVIDPAAHYVIPLISGHWGGGNEFARHIASLIKAQPVITTASDVCGKLPLDLLLRDAGLRLLDWQELPALQARLLEGRTLTYNDPWRILPQCPALCRKTSPEPVDVCIHWRKHERKSGRMRVALPILHLGIGMRKNIDFDLLHSACEKLLAQLRLEEKAIVAFATVQEKGREPALLRLSAAMSVPVKVFDAQLLAAIPTPNPSTACGRRFGLPPFSVCEAAAVASARQQARKTLLIAPKHAYGHCITMAVAIALPL